MRGRLNLEFMTYSNGNKNAANVSLSAFVFYDSDHLSAGRSSVPKGVHSRSQLSKYEYNIPNCNNTTRKLNVTRRLRGNVPHWIQSWHFYPLHFLSSFLPSNQQLSVTTKKQRTRLYWSQTLSSWTYGEFLRNPNLCEYKRMHFFK
jgi:hypothetical protein